MFKIRFAMMGRSYDTTAPLPDELELSEGACVDDALAIVRGLLPPGAQLPPSCLIVCNGQHLGTVGAHENPALDQQDELVLIAPVAGG